MPGRNKIVYHPDVVSRDIPRLDKTAAARIRRAIEDKLNYDPEIYGIPLRGTLRKYWKLRIGDWRVVFTIGPEEVFILVIAHRKDVYQKTERRKK
ncbi:MAG: type II toxin-antitoxin system RelE/ParE family toxin [Candidatus Taylorbacteria bacterium]|nr:type II toxin-antitoxin system RelE/ParE family toxin [Candidatus Taylorbacteria bacterium]